MVFDSILLWKMVGSPQLWKSSKVKMRHRYDNISSFKSGVSHTKQNWRKTVEFDESVMYALPVSFLAYKTVFISGILGTLISCLYRPSRPPIVVRPLQYMASVKWYDIRYRALNSHTGCLDVPRSPELFIATAISSGVIPTFVAGATLVYRTSSLVLFPEHWPASQISGISVRIFWTRIILTK